MRIFPVILCGGSGSRLWPASRPSRPKQFVGLLSEQSLFQAAVLRMHGLVDAAPPLVVAGVKHVASVLDQLERIGIDARVLAEPEGRDSAPAIAAAAALIAEEDPHGVAVIIASDHHIPDAEAFRAALATAAEAAHAGQLVTLGVKPAHPSTAYGYIKAGAPLKSTSEVRRVVQFIEKPDARLAEAYVGEGHLWNSGNFIFDVGVFLDELGLHASDVHQAAVSAVAGARRRERVILLSDAFNTAPRISVDYAVMEKTDRAAVLPVAFEWSDLGAWDAVWAGSEQDEAGNVTVGDTILAQTVNSLVRASPDVLVTTIGLRNIAVIVEPDAVLVCDMSLSQNVKQLVDQLSASGRAQRDFQPPDRENLTAISDRLRLWLATSALPLWWTLGADHVGGGFHEVLDVQGGPVASPRRARVQARQVYVYATAGAAGWPGPWRDAVGHGLDYLRARYRREDGLLRTLVSADGSPLDETAMLYDQAFGLLALASAAEALPSEAGALRIEAEALLARIQKSFAHPDGGFREAKGSTPFLSNPHMHLFEAALAWQELSPGAPWAELAHGIAELALTRFIDPEGGFLREYFDQNWRPAEGDLGRVIEPGHQFEWAWLLERWGRVSNRPDAQAAARRLFNAGERGVDKTRGVALDGLWDDFTVREGSARLWPQTERLKAALILAEEDTHRSAALAAAMAVDRYLRAGVAGLWGDRLLEDNTIIREPSPASSFYHLSCAIRQMT